MLDWFQDIMSEFGNTIVDFLPVSPVARYIDTFSNLPYLSWLNWFVPVASIITIGETWLVCIGLFYMYSIILRWIKAIG